MNVTRASLFSQLLREVDRNTFQRLVAKTGSEKRSKGFNSWEVRTGHIGNKLTGHIGYTLNWANALEDRVRYRRKTQVKQINSCKQP